MTEERVKVIITADNKTNTAFRGASSSVRKFDKDVSKLTKRIGVGLVAAFGGAAVASVSFAKEAASALSIQDSFERMTHDIGVSGDELLDKLNEVSAGTVSNADLMLASNRAMALGVAKDLGDFTQLMEIARLKGREMGITTTQAFNDIVTGIGRQSPLILDNLGITIKAEEAQKVFAESIGKTAEQLTAAEKSQALLNAVMIQGSEAVEEAGELQETAQEKVERLNASWANMKVQLGAVILEALVPFIEKITAWATDPRTQQQLTTIIAGFTEFGRVAIPIVVSALEVLGKVFGTIHEVMKKVGETLLSIINAVWDLVDAIRELSDEGGGGFLGLIKGAASKVTEDILGFAEGGVVPGPIGAPVPALVHGGETIIPHGKTVGGTVQVSIYNPVVFDDSMVDRMSDQVGRALRTELRV